MKVANNYKAIYKQDFKEKAERRTKCQEQSVKQWCLQEAVLSAFLIAQMAISYKGGEYLINTTQTSSSWGGAAFFLCFFGIESTSNGEHHESLVGRPSVDYEIYRQSLKQSILMMDFRWQKVLSLAISPIGLAVSTTIPLSSLKGCDEVFVVPDKKKIDFSEYKKSEKIYLKAFTSSITLNLLGIVVLSYIGTPHLAMLMLAVVWGSITGQGMSKNTDRTSSINCFGKIKSTLLYSSCQSIIDSIPGKKPELQKKDHLKVMVLGAGINGIGMLTPSKDLTIYPINNSQREIDLYNEEQKSYLCQDAICAQDKGKIDILIVEQIPIKNSFIDSSSGLTQEGFNAQLKNLSSGGVCIVITPSKYEERLYSVFLKEYAGKHNCFLRTYVNPGSCFSLYADTPHDVTDQYYTFFFKDKTNLDSFNRIYTLGEHCSKKTLMEYKCVKMV